MPGFRALETDEEVEFKYEQRQEDSFQYVATWVRQVKYLENA